LDFLVKKEEEKWIIYKSKKMTLDIDKKTTEALYREHPALSQSKLKTLLTSPKAFLDDTKKSASYFDFGTLVDMYLFDREKEIKDSFYILKDGISVPSDTVQAVLQRVVDISCPPVDFGNNLESYKQEILSICKNLNYGQSWKEETLLAKFTEYGPYFKQLKESVGKSTVTENTLNSAKKKAELVKENEYIKFLFEKESEDVEIFTNSPLFFEVNGISCKALLDLYKVNHKLKEIYPADLKTTGDNVLRFSNSFIKYRYDIQAAFYVRALKEKYPDYTIKSFYFMVIESSDFETLPMLYEASLEEILFGTYGGYLKNGYFYKGYETLLEEYKWHIENNLWDYPKEYYENKVTRLELNYL